MQETAIQASNNLLDVGIVGTVCVLLIAALAFVYKSKERAAREHRDEMKALMERHIEKAEYWVENGQKLATDLNRLLESLSRGRA